MSVQDDDPMLGRPGSDFDQRRPLDMRDFSRRTLLANERTYLAWWRTGLTSLTVALASGRILPELVGAETMWPYLGLGILFSLLGMLCIAYGERRRRAVSAALIRGEFAEAESSVMFVLTALGVIAGVVIIALMIVGA